MTPEPSSSNRSFQHVPAWLARHYPAVAALEDNPLYLAMTGQGYCHRRLFWRRRKRWFHRNNYGVFLIVFLISFCVFWPLALGMLLLAFAGYFSDYFSGGLRDEARVGRLQDIYLSMRPEDIADAVTGARVFAARWSYLLGFILCGLLAIAFMVFMAVNSDEDMRSMLCFFSCFFVFWTILLPFFYLESVLIGYGRFGMGTVIAADFTFGGRSISGLTEGLESACFFFLRALVPGALAVFSGIFTGFICAYLGMPVVWVVIETTATIMFIFTASHFAFAWMLIPYERRRAIGRISKHLAAIIEYNPPVAEI